MINQNPQMNLNNEINSQVYYWESLDRLVIVAETSASSDVWASHEEGLVYPVSREVFDAALTEPDFVLIGDF